MKQACFKNSLKRIARSRCTYSHQYTGYPRIPASNDISRQYFMAFTTDDTASCQETAMGDDSVKCFICDDCEFMDKLDFVHENTVY